MNVINEIRSTLKKANLRVTPQRVAICEYLSQNNNHPTAQMIYEEVKLSHPNISLMTVYNTLNALNDQGIINEIGRLQDEHAHFDQWTNRHLHLMCIDCGEIEDLEIEALDSVEQHISERSGFFIDRAKLIYYGVCRECQLVKTQTQ